MSLTATSFAEPPRLESQRLLVLGGLSILGLGALWLGTEGWHYGVLFLIGGLFGMSLYHAAFGFTSAYRNAILRRDVSGVIAQIIMIGLAAMLFAPVLAEGEVFGRGVVGAVAPAGVQVAVGSFLFGLGMQLGGGCGSGTLYTVGGGSTRMVLTLIAFIAGAFLGSLDMDRWADLPSWGSVALGSEVGWGAAMMLQLAVLAAIWLALAYWGRGVQQQPLWPAGFDWRRLLTGPWPLLLSAGLLALLNWLTLLIAGHPWSITWAFTLWGAKVATVAGWDPATSAFWTGGFQERALGQSVFRDITSIMDFGIVLGALTAAGLAGRFSPVLRVPPRALLAAVIGGLLMGYGARLAYGCNIGAFFSGVASTSLHGWLWIVCAIAGTWIGVRLRSLFQLEN